MKRSYRIMIEFVAVIDDDDSDVVSVVDELDLTVRDRLGEFVETGEIVAQPKRIHSNFRNARGGSR